jgi:CRISPR-associated protein Csh1
MDYKQNLKEKYAYRSGSANGANLSPSAKLTEIQKTVNNKIIKWFAKYKDSEAVEPEEKEFLENIEQELIAHSKEIIEDCTKSISGIPNKESKFISLLFEELDEDEEEDWKYLGDFPVFNN